MSPVASSSSAPAQWIPLRDDYFETPLLSSKETAYLVRKSCEAAQQVVERARSSGGPIQWRHIEKYNDVQLYAGFSRGTYSAEPSSMCGVTSVPGTIKEIAALFDLPTTRAMKDFSRAHRELFLDAVVLYTLSPRTRERPLHQVTAKWVATRSPKGLDDRDYCYLECQDKFMDSTGRKGWVLCLHSIKLPGCDDLSREFGFVRGSFYHSGIVVVEGDRPGFVDIIHMLQINLKNNTKMPQSYLRERVAWISKIKNVLREKRLNEQRYLSDLELVPKKYRSRCNVCQDSFSLLLLRKMNCRKCGEVVCGACSKDFDVTNAKFLETVKLRICMHCYQLITAGQMLGSVLDQPQASTSLSLLGYYDDTHRASIITEGMPDGRRGTNRERPTRIILHSMTHRQQQADRRSRHARDTIPRNADHRETIQGYRMSTRDQFPPPPPAAHMNTDPTSHTSRRVRPTTGPPPPPRASASNGHHYERDYDSRSLFDRPQRSSGDRGSRDQLSPTTQAPQVPTPPASLFDRRSTRVKLDDYDLRRAEEIKNNKLPLAAPSPRSKPRNSTRDSRGNFKIPHSLYDYSSMDPDAHKPQAPSSPIQRNRGDSNSSVSSTGSIDIDSYEVGKANVAKAVAAQEQASVPSRVDEESGQSYQSMRTLLRNRDDDNDYDTEGSVGSGDDEPIFVQREKQPVARKPPPYLEEEEEETKSADFEATPPLPPPSPSAYITTHAALLASGHSDSMDLPFKRRNYNVSDLSSVNTADCDVNYLDTEMRQFHGQPFFMRGSSGSDERSTIDHEHRSDSFMNSPAASSDHSKIQRASESSPVSTNAPLERSQSPVSKTSPTKPVSMVIRPPLYGRPKEKEPISTSCASSVSSSSSGDAAVIKAGMTPAGSRASPQFEIGNDTLLSTVPSTHSNEDLTFAAEGGQARGERSVETIPEEAKRLTGSHTSDAHRQGELSTSTTRRSQPPPPYLPSRFQSRQQPAVDAHTEDNQVAPPLSTSDFFAVDGHDSNGKSVVSDTNELSSNHQEVDEDDVDFEELLRMSMIDQDENNRHRRLTIPAALLRSDTFDVARASTDTDLGEFHDSSDSESESDLLSARRMYSKFNSSKNLAKVAGVSKNPNFQRTFEQIQESIHMLSDSEDESEDDDDWTPNTAAKRV